VSHALSRLLAAATLFKLAGELSSFWHLQDLRLTPLKRSALLMRDDLRSYTSARFAVSLAAVALVLLGRGSASMTWAAGAFILLVAGELLERTLFFAAASSPGMPGGLR
jgi:DMSO reductase anchor subunit